MEHRLVLAVFAEEGDIFAEIHILEVVRDKAAVATLNSLSELFDCVRCRVHELKISNRL